MTTPCPSTTDLRGLVNGSLSDSEADSLQLHLERCESCQNALQEIAADGDFWQSAAQNLSDDEAAGPALERVVEELQHQSPEDAEEMGDAIELKLSFIDPPTEPGTIGRLKHYDILRVAGRGGMGIVLKAFDRTLRRVVAVKMLAPHLAGNGQAKQRFIREGRSAAGICHDHVVTIHAVEESPPFIVMQYVKGETLEARIHRNGSLEVREAIRIAKQIAQGLAAAHTQGVVHRDIKPANILLENGVARVRITDFGLARAVDDASLTQSGVVAGTPQYMAPEQANGDAVDERADLFSLGSVLYTMLAGHAPFRATTTMGVLKRLCDNTARPIREINPEVPEWLVMMINRLHAKRPADRFQYADEVASLLERGLASLQNGNATTMTVPTVGASTTSEPTSVDGHSVSAPESDRPVEQPLPQWLGLRIPSWMIATPLILFFALWIGSSSLDRLDPETMSVAAGLSLAGFIGLAWANGAASRNRLQQSGVNETASGTPFDRFSRRVTDVMPRRWYRFIGWLFAWSLPVLIWTVFFFLEESWAVTEPVTSLADRDRDMQMLAAAAFSLWWLIAILWFRRRRPDGSQLFPERRAWRVFAILTLAAIFCSCGLWTWFSDVHYLATHRTMHFPLSDGASVVSRNSPSAGHLLKLEFEKPLDGTSLVIELPNNEHYRFTSEHGGVVMTGFGSRSGTFPWKAYVGCTEFASGEVTLTPHQLAEIKVPQPRLGQLIAGTWTKIPTIVASGMLGGRPDGGMEYGAEDEPNYRFEFDSQRLLIAISENDGRLQRSDFSFEIDASVSPALINLIDSDGSRIAGILQFLPGWNAIGEGEGGMMSPMGTARPESTGMPGMGHAYTGAPGMDMHDGEEGAYGSGGTVDRLEICLNDGSGLRPWEFKANDQTGQTLFSLRRADGSGEGTLRERLAFEPIVLETSVDLITESVQAWSKRLNIDGTGTNSLGMAMVLVPPAAYHLIDPPHLSKLRRQLPEPDSVRDVPDFKYEFPPKLKQQITKRHKVVSYPFVMARRTVTIEQFRQFIDETGYVTDAERGTTEKPASAPETKGGWHQEGGLFNWADRLSWKDPISADADVKGLDRPVAVISWRDATEFCKWLSEKEGRQYRLPKNDEWTAAMQLGAARKPLPPTNSDDPMINDYYGWFDATSKHPLEIARTDDTFAEWTLDAQFGSKPDRMVLVHHEVSADGVRFYLGTQFTADKSFRAASVGFRVVAELQVLAAENPDEEPSDSPPAEVTQ